MALQWKTIPYSDEVAAVDHTHVEADITDLSHDAVSLQGKAVADTAPDDGDALVWNATAEQWEPAAVEGTGGATALDDLTDVTLGTPQTGDVLVYDTDHWEAAAPGAPAVHTHAGTDITSAVANATDADTLDGQHASEFASAGHDHDADYAPTDHTHADYTTVGHTHAGTDITSAVANATDADTLDGQHASEFAPTEHTHALEDIEGLAPNVEETGDLIIGFNDIESVDQAATATVISFSNYAPPYAPANLLDGDDGTYWNAGSYTAGSYVTLDLGSALPVNYIRVLNSDDEDYRANFEVEYSDDDVTYTLAHRFSAITTAETAVYLPDTITARYWKIRSTGYTYGSHNWILYAWELREFTGSICTYPLAVGANGQILVADDAETLGVKWADHDHSADFAAISHTHVEADITDLSHDAVSLQGNAISNAAPSDGDTLVWNELAALWTPGAVSGEGGGGTLASMLDVGIPTTPDNGQVLTWQTGAGQWKAISLPAAPSTARVREFDFQPEYAGAVIDPATLGDGILEAYVEAGQNAYEWTVIAATEESVYLYLRWRLPPGFTSFAGPLKVTSKVSNVAKNCGVELLGLYDATGANAIAYTTFKHDTWTESSANLVAGSFAAGDLVHAKLRLFGQDTSVTYLAGIRIQYNGD